MNNRRVKIGDYYFKNINDYLGHFKSIKREKDQLRILIVEEYIRRGNLN